MREGWNALTTEKLGGYDAGGGGYSPITYRRRSLLEITGRILLVAILAIPVTVAVCFAAFMVTFIEDIATAPAPKDQTTIE